MDLIKIQTLLLLLSVGGTGAQDALLHGPVYAQVGQNVTFNTTVGDGSFLTIAWSFHGVELVPVVTVAPASESYGEGYEGRVTVNKKTGMLILGPVKPEDDGDYSVTMVDKHAITETGETTLRVLVPVSKVEIKPSLKEALETNSTVTLNCSALGSYLTFTWTNGTRPLIADDKRISIKHEDLSSTVTITRVQRWELKGPIYCSATNKLESERSLAFNMSVHYGPEAVMMTASPPVGGPAVRKLSDMTLSCSAVSDPPALFSWYHNGAAVAGQTASILVLKAVTEKQSGKYHCSALNAKTLRTADSKPITFTVLEAISGVKITPPKGPLMAGGPQVLLSCAAAAGTVSSAAWLKNNKPLVSNDRVVVNGSQVTIKKVQKEDRGDYTCQLTNAVNTEADSYNMVVFYGPDGPDGVKISGKTEVEVNTAVSLKCAADSFPAAFMWYLNDTALGVTTSTYDIASAAYKDSGTYTCQVANNQTTLKGSDKFQLAVKEEGALDSLSGGAIAGIVIGVLAVLGLAIAGLIYCRRKQTIESPY